MTNYRWLHWHKLVFCLIFALTACSDSGSGGGGSDHLPSLTLADQSYAEQSIPITLNVTLSHAADHVVSVDYALQDGTATVDEDYLAASGTLTFQPGVTEVSVLLHLIDDAVEEADEYFTLVFSNADGIQLETPNVKVTIMANDTVSWSDESEYDPHWGIQGAFADAASCGNCHSAATDDSGVLRYPKQADGEDISPYAGWRHTAMAHSFDDPYFQAVVQDETEHFPSLAGTIEDKCLTCHSPMARTYAHETGLALDTADCPTDEDGCYRMDSAHSDMSAREGVSCTLCHQISADNLGTAFSGGYEVDADAKVISGPYMNPVTNPMANNTQYTVAGGAHMQTSEVCAVCHNLKTPSVDVDTHTLTGTEFVEQAPYSEWLNSTFNEGDAADKICQDCHMPTIDGYQSQIATTASGNANTNWPERSDYSQHLFLGGNNYLLELLKNYRDVLGIEDTTTVAGFEQQQSQNSSFLTDQAAQITIANVGLVDGELQVDVTVTNKSGHKLPTSFPSRRAWVNLMVKNAAGDVLFASGSPDENGYLAEDTVHAGSSCTAVEKEEGYDSEVCYSKHLDVITSSDEAVVYEAVMADTRQHPTYVLLHADSYLKDNRIPPAGFTTTGANYSAEIAIVGDAASDADFNKVAGVEGSGSDTVHYRLDWTGKATAGLQVEAIFYYQSIRPAFVTGLKQSGDKIDRFNWMYGQIKPQPVVLSADSESFSTE